MSSGSSCNMFITISVQTRAITDCDVNILHIPTVLYEVKQTINNQFKWLEKGKEVWDTNFLHMDIYIKQGT